MRSVLKYIVMMICALSFISCSMGEFDALRPDENNTIEFIARPTGFVTTNVTTKAAKEGWETYVYNAYLLLFDEGGIIIDEPKELTVSNNAILPYRFTLDEGSFAKAYILANVPAGSVDFSNTSELESKVLDLTYETSSDNYIAAPTLNGNPCLPMLGVATLSDKKANKVTIELKSLFAKINLNLKMDLATDISGWTQLLKGDATFKLTSYTLNNLPMKVALTQPDESEWVAEPEVFHEPITITPSEVMIDNDGESYSICCYIPEYVLKPNASNTDETQKPLKYNENKHPIYFTIKGVFTHPNLSNQVDFTYDIFIGENNSDNFTILRNNLYNFNMTITGIDDARLDIDERVDAKIEVTDLAAVEPSNCYIIPKIGRYRFPACKGYDRNLRVEITDSPTVITDGKNKISNCRLVEAGGETYFEFDVNMEDLAAITDGNIILDFGTWSWHLWFAPNAFDGNTGSLNFETYNTGATMLSRNLGASSARATGMYYKWGNKNPYFNSDYTGSGVEDGGWATTKTVNDPCPSGYKVPSNSAWLNSDTWKSTTAGKIQSEDAFIYDFRDPNVLYPYSGYLHSDGSIKSSYTIKKEYYDNKTSFTSIGLKAEDRFSELTLSIELTLQNGYLLSNNKQNLHYGYASVPWSNLRDAITIVKCKKESRKISYSWTGITYGEWEDKGYISGSDLSTNDKAQLLAQLYLKGGVITETIYEFSDNLNDSYGLQVRCVKE